MRRIKVASYGSFLPTMPNAGTITTRRERLAVCASHKFTLAFENTIAADYVTNKLFEVWSAGSVPVYLGAPNVAEFAPSRRSYIDVTDFDGPMDLARYLNHLDEHDDEYEEYLEWKRTGPDDAFLAVSYTHLDVYKRQASARRPDVRAGSPPRTTRRADSPPPRLTCSPR